jgi:hypothetical protein
MLPNDNPVVPLMNHAGPPVISTKEHVQYITDFLDKVYTKAGLDKGAEDDKAGDVIDQDHALQIVGAVRKNIESIVIFEDSKIVEILKWMGAQIPSFSQDQLKARFHLVDKKEARPLLGSLQNEGLITRAGRGGFTITEKGVAVVKLIPQEEQPQEEKSMKK